MRHMKSGKRLGVAGHRRKAMMKQLVEALFLHGRIKTTLTRAKATKPVAEKMITLAKKGTLHHRRQAMTLISRKDVVNRIFDQMADWYKERQGGYTRIIKIGKRPGDAAEAVYLELVDWVAGEKLLGQNAKSEKVAVEEEQEGEKKEKAKKKKVVKKVVKKVEKLKKVTKTDEQKKKIAARKAETEKVKKERAAAREKAKKAKLEGKADRQKAAKTVRNSKKKLVKKVELEKKAAKKKAAKKVTKKTKK